MFPTLGPFTSFITLIARFKGPTWDPSVADRTQVGPHVGAMNFAIWVVLVHCHDYQNEQRVYKNAWIIIIQSAHLETGIAKSKMRLWYG